MSGPDAPAFPCEPIPDDAFESAPTRYRNVVELSCSAERLFAVLEDADAWPRWAPGIAKVTWTSSRPFGVGTTRTVAFWGGAEVYERFLAWTEPSLLVFQFEGASELIWRWFGERYEVVALGPDRCRLTWTVAYEPAGGFGRLHPWIRPFMALNFKLYMTLLRRYVRRA